MLNERELEWWMDQSEELNSLKFWILNINHWTVFFHYLRKKHTQFECVWEYFLSGGTSDERITKLAVLFSFFFYKQTFE